MPERGNEKAVKEANPAGCGSTEVGGVDQAEPAHDVRSGELRSTDRDTWSRSGVDVCEEDEEDVDAL